MAESSEDIFLTFAKIKLQWYLNKAKSDPDTDYSVRINFMKIKSKENKS